MNFKSIARSFVLACVILAPFYSHGQAHLKTKFGKGVTFIAPDSSMKMKLGVRFQPLFVAEAPLADNSQIVKELTIRRFRLKFDGFVHTPRLVYKIELALSNRDNGSVIPEGSNAANIVLDASAEYALRDNLFIKAGQFKLPGNRERVISSQKLQFVDRSLVNGRYNLDRDQGIMLTHQFSLGSVVVRDLYALTLGQGRNISAADPYGMNYTGRLEVLPFGLFEKGGDYFSSDLARESTPKLSVGGGLSYNDDAQRQGGELGRFLSEQRDLTTYFADMIFKFRGFSVLSEYMYKTTDNPVVGSREFFRTGDGFVVQAGYLFKNNYEIAGRYATINPELALLDNRNVFYETEYTLGVSKYIVGHSLKVQTDLAYLTNENKFLGDQDDAIRFRLQFEIAL